MRRMVLSLVAVGFVESALAADYGGPVLRGSQTYQTYVPGDPVYYRWDGAYIGAQGGASSMTGVFPGSVSDQFATVTSGTPIDGASVGLGTIDTTKVGATYGAFIGYNAQWENAVLGMELNYNHTSTTLTGSNSAAFAFAGFDVTGSATSSVKVTDMGTIRGRAGWVFDNWLPYGFVGLAIARAETSQSATLSYTAGGVTVGPLTASQNDNGHIQYGWALGAGVDWAITPSLFLRAEYEYMQFNEFDSIKLRMNSARAGLGMRF